jgi:hypothetical protein
MSRMVPFKELWSKLIAAWKTTFPRDGAIQWSKAMNF